MIKLREAVKKYGRSVSIDNLTLELNEKKIICLLGRNGAGKTTLMKLIAGHINGSSGTIEVAGIPVSTSQMPEQVSFIESRGAQFNATLGGLIAIAGQLDRDFNVDFAWSMGEKLHLNKDKKYNHLSFGMQTIVTTLLSLSSNKPVVLLDEPVLGLDAIMRSRFYELLNESFENHPRLILVSTHLIDEIAQSAEDLIILEKGRVLFQSPLTDIDEFAYSVTGPTDRVNAALEGYSVIGQKHVSGHTTAFVFEKENETPGELLVQPVSLQEFFIGLVGGYSDED